MRIYRIEHRMTHVGPFTQPWFCLRKLAEDTGCRTIPNEMQVVYPTAKLNELKAIKRIQHNVGSSSETLWRFGFVSRRALCHWFEPPLRAALHERGFHVVVFERDADDVFTMQDQAVVCVRDGAPVETIPLNKLALEEATFNAACEHVFNEFMEGDATCTLPL